MAGGLAFLSAALFIGSQCYSATSSPEGASKAPPANAPAGYARHEVSTFLTLPEWFIVYSAEEQARFTGTQPPSRFPYLRSIGQFWRYYGAVCGVTRGICPFHIGDHLMLAVLFTFILVAGNAEYQAAWRREQEEAYWREMARQAVLAPPPSSDEPPLILHGPN